MVRLSFIITLSELKNEGEGKRWAGRRMAERGTNEIRKIRECQRNDGRKEGGRKKKGKKERKNMKK